MTISRIAPVQQVISPSEIQLFSAVREDYIDEAWVASTDASAYVLLQWPTTGDESLPPDAAAITDVLQGTDEDGYEPPMIVDIDLTSIDTLSIGQAMLIEAIGQNGNIVDVDDIIIDGTETKLTVTELSGRHKLYLAGLHENTRSITDENLVAVIEGTHRVCWNALDDNDINKDWESVQYLNGTTIVTFPADYDTQTVTLYTTPIQIAKVYAPRNTTQLTVSFAYPIVQLNSQRYTMTGYPIIRTGETFLSTTVTAATNLLLLAPKWALQMVDVPKITVGNTSYVLGQEALQRFMRVDWYSIIGRPVSTPQELDAAVDAVALFQMPALTKLELVDGLLGVVDGPLLEGPHLVTTHTAIEGVDNVFTIDMSVVKSVTIAPTDEYTVQFTNRPDVTHTVYILITNGGAYTSTWGAIFSAIRSMADDGVTLLKATVVPTETGSGSQVFVDLV